MTIIHGQVVDPQDLPLAQVAIYVISAPVSMPDIAQLTGELGEFTLSAPAPGSYTIGARSEKWGTTQAEVEVQGVEPVAVKMQFGAESGLE
ncbi:MAG: carboxypeptidase regulatory-like domain-containing protein [Caldilineaceae bacterium]|nr:carboxypeptidase regulatory-like domain-containing protein [Caldilineaceae bacterium]